MNKNEILYIIGDYCAQYEIEMTAEQIEEAADVIGDQLWAVIEYNARCGIYSANIDNILDAYFSDF